MTIILISTPKHTHLYLFILIILILIQGLSAGSCAEKIEGALLAYNNTNYKDKDEESRMRRGVANALVSFSTNHLLVQLATDIADSDMPNGKGNGRPKGGPKGGNGVLATGVCRGARDVLEIVRQTGYGCNFISFVDPARLGVSPPVPPAKGVVAHSLQTNDTGASASASTITGYRNSALAPLLAHVSSLPRYHVSNAVKMGFTSIYGPSSSSSSLSSEKSGRGKIEVSYGDNGSDAIDMHAAESLEEGDVGMDSDLQQWQKLLTLSLILGLPVIFLHLLAEYVHPLMYLMMEPAATSICGSHGVTFGQLLMLILNTPIQFYVGYRYYRAAYLSALHGNFGMDCLVVTGTTITYTYSLYQLFQACHRERMTEHVFFETSGMLITFVTLGKYLEARSKGITMGAVGQLMKMQPKTALLLVDSEEEEEKEKEGTRDTDNNNNNNNNNYNTYGSGGKKDASANTNTNTNTNTKKKKSEKARGGKSTYGTVMYDSYDSYDLSNENVSGSSSPSPSASPSSSSHSHGDDRLQDGPESGPGRECVEIPVELLQRGDTLKVLPGAAIPTDAGMSNLSLSLRFKGLFLNTVGVLFHVECCIR